jgi:hypothetical protein
MKKGLMILLAAISGCICVEWGCTQHFDLYAPEEDIWVVYGVLHEGDSVQYVRVSKAFQVEGDALAYAAQVPLTVPGLSLRLDGPDGSIMGQQVDTIMRDSGLFNPNQT